VVQYLREKADRLKASRERRAAQGDKTDGTTAAAAAASASADGEEEEDIPSDMSDADPDEPSCCQLHQQPPKETTPTPAASRKAGSRSDGAPSSDHPAGAGGMSILRPELLIQKQIRDWIAKEKHTADKPDATADGAEASAAAPGNHPDGTAKNPTQPKSLLQTAREGVNVFRWDAHHEYAASMQRLAAERLQAIIREAQAMQLKAREQTTDQTEAINDGAGGPGAGGTGAGAGAGGGGGDGVQAQQQQQPAWMAKLSEELAKHNLSQLPQADDNPLFPPPLLNINAFTHWVEADESEAKDQLSRQHRRIHSLARRLTEVAIPQLVKTLLMPAQTPVSTRAVKRCFHRHGVNLRYLGTVLAKCSQAEFVSPVLLAALEREIVMRTAAYVINGLLKEVPPGRLAVSVAHLLNCLMAWPNDETGDAADLTSSPTSTSLNESPELEPGLPDALQQVTVDSMWGLIRERSEEHFRHPLPQARAQCGVLRSAAGRFGVLRGVCEKVGIQLVAPSSLGKVLSPLIEPWEPSCDAQSDSAPEIPEHPNVSEVPEGEGSGSGDQQQEEEAGATPHPHPDSPSNAPTEAAQAAADADVQSQSAGDSPLANGIGRQPPASPSEKGPPSSGRSREVRVCGRLTSDDVAGLFPVVKSEGPQSVGVQVWMATAQRCLNNEMIDIAMQALEQAAATYNNLLNGAPAWEMADCYHRLGGLQMSLGEMPSAYQNFSRALAHQEQLGGVDAFENAELHCQMGIALLFMGHPFDAIRYLHRAAELYRLWCGLDHPDLPMALVHAARCALQLHQAQPSAGWQRAALILTQRAGHSFKRIAKANPGPMYLVQVHDHLAGLNMMLCEFRESLHHTRQQRSILAALEGDQHPKVKELDALLTQLTRRAVAQAIQDREKRQDGTRSALLTKLRTHISTKRQHRNMPQVPPFLMQHHPLYMMPPNGP